MAMMIDSDIERQIEQRARQRGYPGPMDYLCEVLKEHEQLPVPEPSPTRGQRLVDQLRGKATRKLTTDQIMAMTRG
jgi:hypothetical protein